MAFGGEGLFHGGQGYTHIFGRAKYFDDENEFNATLSTANTFSTSYARKIGQFVHLAAEYEVNLSTRKSLMNCGWEFILRRGQARVSGTISTEGIIATQVAKVVDPMTTVFFKSILDHS